MFKTHARFYHDNKLDPIDAALLEAVFNRIIALQDLAEYIGQRGKIAVVSHRLKRMEKRGWMVSGESRVSGWFKTRMLTPVGKKMLSACRRYVL